MNTVIKRGALIVVEGVDRSGKSTQCRKIVETLKSMKVSAELMVFPDRTTKTGQLINEYLVNKDCKLNDQSIHLLFSANRWENVEKIQRCLNNGITLIVDRYSYSGIVFSSAKDGMNFKWCKEPEVGLPKPDIVLLLTLSKEAMMKRPGFGDERYENPTMQNNVATIYKKLIDDSWVVVDAGKDIETVHGEMLTHILRTIENSAEKPLKTLQFSTDKQSEKLESKENNANITNINNKIIS